jgi:transcription antitermination factor NusG
MPLLPLEPFVHPADLLTTSSRDPEATQPWWVLHTRPRAEKTLARKLLARRQDFFLPLYQNRLQIRGRSLASYVPLFPGYVFLRGDEAARLEALRTNQIIRVLPVPERERLRADLARIYQLMECGSPVAPEDRLQVGMPVELTAGPLAGLHGKIIRRNRHMRFVVEVDFIQRGASVEIECWMMQPLGARQVHAANA